LLLAEIRNQNSESSGQPSVISNLQLRHRILCNSGGPRLCDQRPIQSSQLQPVPFRQGHEVRVQLGSSFVLELPGHATGGYVWRVAQEPGVAVLRSERILPAGSAPGGPSMQEFEFVPTHLGSGTLIMELKRPWESTLMERVILTVVVASVS
jgi:predicted secreted protein